MRQPLLTAVRSLAFDEDRSAELSRIAVSDWAELLALTDAAHITLALAARCDHATPEPVRRQLASRIERNVIRHARIVKAHAEIAHAMTERRVDFAVLKGLTHAGFWNGNAHLRPQYDMDLFVPPESIASAREAVAQLGYQACEDQRSNSDHLPVMVRRTGWRWRGDFYDADQPLALELHFRFWNPALGFAAHGAERFWGRRTVADFGGVLLPALHPVDRLRYATWHAARHLLRGSLRVLHIYELASAMHHSANDQGFWREWRAEGPAADRVAESIALRLAREWFRCRVNPVVEEYTRSLPGGVERWFNLFAFSPITGITQPNKDELFLNLCLAQKRRGREIASRRILPRRLPTFLLDAHDQTVDFSLRLRRGTSRAVFIVSRAAHHVRTLPPLLGSGIRWWCSR